MRRVLAWLVCIAAITGGAGPATAGGFVSEKGAIWVKVGYRNWSAEKEFAGIYDRNLSEGIELGDPIDPDPTVDGEDMKMRSLEMQVDFVPLARTHVGVYFPVWQQIRFSNANFTTITTGTGDVRPYVGYQVTPSGARAATTLNARLKIPTTGLETDFQQIPLSEGQFDVAVEQVTSWDPVARLRLTASTLLRYRAPGEIPGSDEVYKPGNEGVLRVTVGGGPVDWLWLKAGYRGLWSTGWETRTAGTANKTDFRSIQEVTGSIYLSWGDWIGGPMRGFALDAGLAWPFDGRDYPRGVTWSVGLAWGGRVPLPW